MQDQTTSPIGNGPPSPDRGANWWLRGALAVALLLCGSWLTSLFVASGPDSWYANLEKVPWTPPSWVFSPVWITLYILMGVSFTLQWREGFRSRESHGALSAFIAQLILNFAYTPVQFGLQWLGGQAALIVAIWLAVIVWVVRLRRVHRIAALLQIPYLLWVSYAMTVGVGLWWLNR